MWCKHAFCWVAVTHCVTGSPGPCRASCSPAKCGWAHQSPCSPSSPRAGTRLTEALNNHTVYVRPFKNSCLAIMTWMKTDSAKYPKNIHTTKSPLLDFLSAPTQICELPQDEVKWKLWQKSHSVASRGAELTGPRPEDSVCQALWLTK